ncbi:MAG: peptidylprolyl isomerase [Bacteroidota bacterium]
MYPLRTILSTLLLTIATIVMAQQDDQRVLFTVEDTPVTVEEFTYIYSKTNGENATFSEESLQEYLDLYVKFKLKVERAKDMRLDTIQVLQEELAGYRRQLSDSYLIDRSITDRLIQEAYDHSTKDVDISHILVAVRPTAAPADTLAAYQRIQAAAERIQKGEDFATVAKDVSEDKYSKDKGGRIGFTTALYPAGLHNLEYAAYRLPENTVSMPIRTKAGYHLLLVNERRPARGEMEVAHIMIRKDESTSSAAAKTQIDSIYNLLQSEASSFDQLARNLSEDTRTAGNGGYLGFFGISRYEKPFEDAAFSLTEDDTYTTPVETSLGWHIIKRLSRKAIQPFPDEKPRLEGKVKQDPRFEDAKKALLRSIRDSNNFREDDALLNEYITTLPDTFTTFRWKATNVDDPRVIFELGDDYEVTLGELATYLTKATRQRVTYAREGDPETVARRLYDQFVDDQLLKFEETQLEKRYPEFRSLMREYEEGILLFEATKMEVWDKAAQDTVGLEKFFTGVAGKYRWAPRARVTTYRVGTNFAEEAEAIRAFASTHTAEEVKAAFNIEGTTKLVAEERTYEKFRNTELSEMEWAVGTVSDLVENKRSRNIKFLKIEELFEPANKTLAEARGYVIADYQDELERAWVAELRKAYDVKINQKVFKSLIQ